MRDDERCIFKICIYIWGESVGLSSRSEETGRLFVQWEDGDTRYLYLQYEKIEPQGSKIVLLLIVLLLKSIYLINLLSVP